MHTPSRLQIHNTSSLFFTPSPPPQSTISDCSASSSSSESSPSESFSSGSSSSQSSSSSEESVLPLLTSIPLHSQHGSSEAGPSNIADPIPHQLKQQ